MVERSEPNGRQEGVVETGKPATTHLCKGGSREASLTIQWLRLRASLQWVRVQCLVGELRSHMPSGVPKRKKNVFNLKFFQLKKKAVTA